MKRVRKIEITLNIEGMNLAQVYPQEFDQMSDSPLKVLLKNIGSFNFADQAPSTENLSGLVGLGTELSTEGFLRAFQHNGLNNICQTTNDDIIYELFIAGIILKKPRLFLNNPLTILGANESSLTPLRVLTENFNSTEHKTKVLDKISKFLEHSRSLNRLKDNISIVVDELFSNVLFSAPVDKSGKAIYKDMARNEKISIPGSKNATIFLVHSENDLFVGCLDPIGSLDRDQFIHVLQKAYSSNEKDTNQSSTGGPSQGLGMRMMLDRSRSLYVVSEKGVRTLVVCHMRLNVSLKKLEHLPKQLHLNCF